MVKKKVERYDKVYLLVTLLFSTVQQCTYKVCLCFNFFLGVYLCVCVCVFFKDRFFTLCTRISNRDVRKRNRTRYSKFRKWTLEAFFDQYLY